MSWHRIVVVVVEVVVVVVAAIVVVVVEVVVVVATPEHPELEQRESHSVSVEPHATLI